MQLRVTADAHPGPIRIVVSGGLTRDNFPDLADLMQRRVSSPSRPSLCIDLSGVDHYEPAAAQALELYISQHNAAGGDPEITVDPWPMAHLAAAQTADSEAGLDHMTPTTAVVADLISPLTASIGITQSLREAANLLSETDEGLVVNSLSFEPVGFLPAEHLRAVMESADPTWQKKLCSSLMQTSEHRIRPEHAVEGIIHQYRDDGAQTMLVFNGETAVGLLHPETVYQWCREQGIQWEELPESGETTAPRADVYERDDVYERGLV